MKTMQKTLKVKIGNRFACKYPQHGSRNILTWQLGEVVAYGNGDRGKHGPFVTIKRRDGSYRSLALSKMIDVALS